MSGLETLETLNQSPDFVDIDLYAADRGLAAAVAAFGAGAEMKALSDFGRRWGSAEMCDRARLANGNPPVLRTYDPKGFRLDTVEFHPAYHSFMAESIAAGMQAMTWTAEGARAAAPAEVARAARYYMIAQVENGHMCPVTMTRAAIGALAADPALLSCVMPKVALRTYDPTFKPWTDKSGITIGMGMTEKQGGTDVRANTTRAEPTDEGYLLTGHKWFMSAPMCDAFMVLAQAPGGLTCFFLPRFIPGGEQNALRLRRLKNKLGNRSNASAEVEFERAFAWRVGDEGNGVRTIIEMVQLTRLDCAISSAGMMRMALALAVNHARYRKVFHRLLADQPLMRTVLADLALEAEAAMAVMLRLCQSYDLEPTDPREAARARMLTPVVKYWICKTAPGLIYEAMECLGGNGYVEESILPRLYREAPVNAIWEGSGNVVCLDVLRVLSREGEIAQTVLADIGQEVADLPGCADALKFVSDTLSMVDAEGHARAAVEQLALVVAAAALRASAPDIAELFAINRVACPGGRTYGAVKLSIEQASSLLDRTLA